jgi:amidase
MAELWQLPATELATLIRSGHVSAREAVQAALDRLDDVNDAVNAVVDYRPAEALSAADAIDAQLSDGHAGPLAGVPVTVKTNVDQAGFATTEGVTLQRDLIAETNNPVVDNLLKAGAVIIGRTNMAAFASRWFTSNRLYGDTRNPRNSQLTPGGSSGGAAAAVATGIGAIAHGTDIAGSIRYPAYACGVHGLRPTLGRVPTFNASLPERTIGGQISAVSGPLARSVADLRLAFTAMSRRDLRDPWWVPAPLEGPSVAKRAAICVAPDGLETQPEVANAVRDAGARLERAGWHVEETATTPPLAEAADAQTKLVFIDGYADKLRAAEREGDPGALNVLTQLRAIASSLDLAELSRLLTRRATLLRQWLAFLDAYPVVVMPVSGELPFENNLDMQGDAAFARVWRAQMPQLGLPYLGLPAATVSTGLVGRTPVGVQIVSSRYREDLCLAAGEAIEAGGTPPSPVDPADINQ